MRIASRYDSCHGQFVLFRPLHTVDVFFMNWIVELRFALFTDEVFMVQFLLFDHLGQVFIEVSL